MSSSVGRTSPFPFVPLERRELTPEEFRADYMGPMRPIVLAGAAKRWSCWNKWSADWFVDRFGSTTVPVRNFEANQNWGSQRAQSITLSEFVEQVYNKPWTQGGRAPLLDYSGFFRADPALKQDVPLHELTDSWLNRLPQDLRDRHENLSFGFLLMGPEGAVYNLHYDYWSAHAFIVHFEGSKRVVVYPPDQTKNLYNGKVDVDRPDLDRFPRFKDAKGRMEGILEPGDVVFVPSRWWHQVSYLTRCLSLNAFIVRENNIAAYRQDVDIAIQLDEGARPVLQALLAQLPAR